MFLMLSTNDRGTRIIGIYTSITEFSLALTKLNNPKDITMKEIPVNQSPKENGMTIKDLNFSHSEDFAIVNY